MIEIYLNAAPAIATVEIVASLFGLYWLCPNGHWRE